MSELAAKAWSNAAGSTAPWSQLGPILQGAWERGIGAAYDALVKDPGVTPEGLVVIHDKAMAEGRGATVAIRLSAEEMARAHAILRIDAAKRYPKRKEAAAAFPEKVETTRFPPAAGKRRGYPEWTIRTYDAYAAATGAPRWSAIDADEAADPNPESDFARRIKSGWDRGVHALRDRLINLRTGFVTVEEAYLFFVSAWKRSPVAPEVWPSTYDELDAYGRNGFAAALSEIRKDAHKIREGIEEGEANEADLTMAVGAVPPRPPRIGDAILFTRERVRQVVAEDGEYRFATDYEIEPGLIHHFAAQGEVHEDGTRTERQVPALLVYQQVGLGFAMVLEHGDFSAAEPGTEEAAGCWCYR